MEAKPTECVNSFDGIMKKEKFNDRNIQSEDGDAIGIRRRSDFIVKAIKRTGDKYSICSRL